MAFQREWVTLNGAIQDDGVSFVLGSLAVVECKSQPPKLRLRHDVSALVVLVVAVLIMGLVFFWSGRYGGRNRIGKTSLRRGANAHTTARGRPKKAYATRDEALVAAKDLTQRDGAVMTAYRCATCAQWHLGHS